MTMTKSYSNAERTAQGFGLASAGISTVALITALTRRSPVGNDTDLDLIKDALATLISQGEETHSKLDTLASKLQELIDAFMSGSININLQIAPGEPEAAVQLFKENIRIATGVTPLSTPLFDWRAAPRVLFKFESTLDQAINLQVVGDIFETTSTRQVNINGPIALPANGTASAGLDWADWHPYVGVQITVPVAPTTGYLQIYAIRKNIDRG